MDKLVLPPIDKTDDKIEALEKDTDGKLQIVLAGESVPKPRRPQISKARQRFARATLSVLNQVIENKTREIDDIEEEDQNDVNAEDGQNNTVQKSTAGTASKKFDEKSPRDPKERRKSETRFPYLRQSSQDTKRPHRKRKLSMATVVNMAQFRRMYISRLVSQADVQPSPVAENPALAVPEPLPERPRFIATLSPEAQFAALKAYEDVLVDKLQTSYPEQRNNLYRVKTPSSKRLTFPRGSQVNHQYRDENLSITPDGRSSQTDHQVDDMRHKRRLTVRFQAGMDILDKLKSSQGQQTTSPRIMPGEEQTEPVNSYNRWIHNWANEFSLNGK